MMNGALFILSFGILLGYGCCAAVNPQTLNITVGTTVYLCNKIKENATDPNLCYVNVAVFNSSSLQFPLENATVTVISGPFQNSSYVRGKHSYARDNTNRKGQVCLPVICRMETQVFVERNSALITASNVTAQKKAFPRSYKFDHVFVKTIVKIYAYYWGRIGGKTGPVYRGSQKQQCLDAGSDNYHVSFNYLTFPDQLVSTLAPVDSTDIFGKNYDKVWRFGADFGDQYTCYFKIKVKMSTGKNNDKVWRFGADFGDQYTCYFKIKVKTNQNGVVVSAYSELQDGTSLGLFITGLMYDTTSTNTIDRAACVQFRCPAYGDDDSIKDMSTIINGTIEVPGKIEGCCVRTMVADEFIVTPTTFVTKSPLMPGNTYGAATGIYSNNNPQLARAKCITGHEVSKGEYSMNVTSGIAFEYDCMVDNCNLPVVG